MRADNPPGVAAQAKQSGREALVKEAFDEWANDSQDAAIDALCDDIAQSIPPAKDSELRESVRDLEGIYVGKRDARIFRLAARISAQ